jgi:hypothetical protein
VYETFTIGMTVVCRTFFDTVIEGEIIAFDANTKMIIIKPTLALDQQLRKGTHMVNIDYIKNISIMKGPQTREKGEDLSMKEELPTDNKVVAESEYEEEPDKKTSIKVPDTQDMPDEPLQEKLLADNGVLTEYKYPHSGNMMTNQKETADITKKLANRDENYNIRSEYEDEPTADSERNERPGTTLTSRDSSPSMNRPMAWLTRRSLETHHDRQRLRGTGGGITKSVPRACPAISPR